MAKKKPKNSDYNYIRRSEIERLEKEKKQAAKKTKRKSSLIHLSGIVALLCAFGVGIAGTYYPEKNYLAVICSLLTGIGMTALSFYYMPIRKSAGKLTLALGMIMLFIAVIMARQLGYLG